MPPAATPATNHPLAFRMALIAFLSQTVTFACMYGSFGVVIMAIEAKLGVSRQWSSLGVPLVTTTSALMAPVAGILAGRVSLRLLMILGVVIGVTGYLLLAVSTSIALNLLAYGLLIGPGLCLTAAVLPSMLVTRWFRHNRGRALGFVHMPIALVLVPPINTLVLNHYGTFGVFALMAALLALTLIPISFVVDYPPDARDPTGEDVAAETAADPGLTAPQLLRRPRFWALTIAMSSIFAGVVMMSAHLVPMAAGWGIDTGRAAVLLGITSGTGMAGTLMFGWLADRLGGGRSLAIGCILSAACWGALALFTLPFPVVALLFGTIGLGGAAALPTFGMAVAEQFGAGSFGRAYGLGNMLALPFTTLAVPVAAAVYVHTGGYAWTLAGQAAFLAVGCLLALSVPRRPAAASGA